MKRKWFLLALCSLFVLFSCNTTKKSTINDPNFIGDFDPIKLESVIAVQYSKLGGIKPQNLDFYFIPRTNTVEVHFKQAVNQLAVILSPENRELIAHSIGLYVTGFEKGTLSTEDPSRKNSFARSKASLSWGLVGLGRNTNAEFYTSHQFLYPKRPYFNIQFLPSPDVKDDTVFSPAVALYFSPAQLEKIGEILNQDTLVSMVNELQKQADSFEVENATVKNAEAKTNNAEKSFDKYEKF